MLVNATNKVRLQNRIEYRKLSSFIYNRVKIAVYKSANFFNKMEHLNFIKYTWS